MKALARIITIFIAINLITAGSALAQSAPAPTPPENSQVKVVAPVLQEQLNAAQKQMEEVQKQMITTQVTLPTFLPHGDTRSALVIPTSEMKLEELASIVEDMTVMARIIDQQLGKEQSRQTWFYGDFLGQGSSTAQTMYLQGYGVLFLRKVDFPLSPTQKVQEEEKKTQKEDVDPVWAQTRRDLYEPQEERRLRKERPEEKYDAEKVENLKTNLIKALKHASNIRNLKPDESVILTVTGSGDYSNAKILVSKSATGSNIIVQNKELRTTGIALPSLPTDSGVSSTTTLIIRAKRADIDAFAKGELDLDKFRQRVQIFIQ